MAQLSNKKVAILATNGFEYRELTDPKKALEDAGAKTEVISPEMVQIVGESKGEMKGSIPVDKTVDEANPTEYDALLLPGGVRNPDRLRLSDKAIEFIKHFVDSGKPIAAICHGPWPLINAGGVRGKRVTSWPSLRVDLENAGATWEDKEVLRDGNLVTSRKPEDIPAFNREMISVFAET
jgi:protease I